MTNLDIFKLGQKLGEAVNNPDVLKDYYTYESKYTQTAFLVYDEKKTKTRHIIFRETSGRFLDWLLNLVYFKVRGRKGIARHGGFVACYLSIHKELNKAIKESPYKQIKFAGFSKGGAITHLAFERMPELHKDKNFLIPATFGSPKVYGLRSVLRLPDRMKDIQRFVYRGDLVTFVPFLFMRFKHTGERIPLGKLRIFPFPMWPKDHYPDNYEKELEDL